MSRILIYLPLLLALASACDSDRQSLPGDDTTDGAPHSESRQRDEAGTTVGDPAPDGSPAGARQTGVSRTGLPPNPMGRIPVLEYHLIGDTEGRWQRSHDGFRRDLEMLYSRGYRPISIAEFLDGPITLPEGMSPILFTFDDASPSQFRYLDVNGQLEVDPRSALGIWFNFRREHPDWPNKATFCVLSGAEAGRSFFGDRGIEGQQSVWRHRKLRMLVDSGFDLCNHTVWHANLATHSDSTVVEQIARLNLAIDSAVPNYKVRAFALPLGEWPRNRELARAGSWKDPRTGRVVAYNFDAIFLVSGGPSRSPNDPEFDRYRITRFQVLGNELELMLDRLDRTAARYVSGR